MSLNAITYGRQLEQLDRIREAFDVADKLNILFVGETIIDEYRYVSRLGLSSKEFVLATVETGVEAFEGGVQAAANHGEWGKCKVVSPHATIKKTRFVDRDFNRKLYEVYDRRAIDLHPILRQQFEDRLQNELLKADVVIVTDFGHGLFGPTPRHMVEGRNHFLAVNSQSNAGNMGYNPVTKWKRADFVCIDEPEARLATAEREASIGFVVERLMERIECNKFLITHGRNGSYGYDGEGWAGQSPAFVTNGIDTIGAGDAVLAVTAPLIAAGLDMETAAIVGNIVGSIKVGIVGHREHVSRKAIMDKLEQVLG